MALAKSFRRANPETCHPMSSPDYAAYSGYKVNRSHKADCRTCRRSWARLGRPLKAGELYSAAVVEAARYCGHASERTRKAERKNMTAMTAPTAMSGQGEPKA